MFVLLPCDSGSCGFHEVGCIETVSYHKLGGETALVQLVRFGASGVKYYNVMLKNDPETGKASKTLLSMPWGTYSIIPNNTWAWAYDPIEPMTNVRISDAATYEVILDMHHKPEEETPLHYDVHN